VTILQMESIRAFRGAAAFLSVVICMLPLGCKSDATIWATEVRSPDGSWIASARTVQSGGFGSASMDTAVYLKQAGVSGPPTEVLAFSCKGPAARPYVHDDRANAGGTIDLAMKWLTPSHLEVTYDKHPDLYFQAVRMDGIEISVRDLSDAPH